MREWSLEKYVTIDEMMVRYKGSYCPVHQYMRNKLKKWGIKFWRLADSISKFTYCFEIYCGKNVEAKVRILVSRGAYGVVMKLLNGLEGKGHCVVMDNFFCSVFLFKDLLSKGIYTNGIVKCNRIGLLLHLANATLWKKCAQGHIEWAMHDS
jgi:hypothetical protein